MPKRGKRKGYYWIFFRKEGQRLVHPKQIKRMPTHLGHPNNSPPLMGGDKGEGETSRLFTPTSILPRQGGGGSLGKFQMPRVSTRGVSLDQGYRNGKPYRESTKSNKEADAKRLLKRREGEISQGKLPAIYFDRYNIVSDQDLRLAAQKQEEYIRTQMGTVSGTVRNLRL
jgi:hypothetical protein